LIGFDMSLLHYRRTFVEKMFALHGKVARLQEDGHRLERDARHYSDLYVLAEQDEVRAMLVSAEYKEIRRDYDAKSRKFFPKSYRPPAQLSFADSEALFPDDRLRPRIAAEYEEQCQLLFPDDDYANFEEVLARFSEIRSLL
jgi:Nucleotidyl transferase AbiEii toxin, Type IV TA system